MTIATPAVTTLTSGGRLAINRRDEATIHTYVAPETGACATSHIIESAHRLVIIDAQFSPVFAQEVKTYADSLGKPIDRLVISHQHADHFAGAQVFGAVPLAAPEGTRAFIQAHGQAIIDRFHIPAQAVIPTEIIVPGHEIVDGLRFEYRLVHDAEAAVNLIILLPEIATIIAQDIVYNHVHLVVDKQDVSAWRAAIVELRELHGYNLVLAGHGLPTTTAVYAEVDTYLRAVEQVYSSGATIDAMKRELLQQFPTYEVAWLVGMAVDLAFDRPRASISVAE